MTAVVDDTETTAAVEETPVPVTLLAPWRVRAAAFAVDTLPGVAVVTTTALAALSVPLRGGWWWSCVSIAGLAIALTAANRALLPTITGWSLGRAIFGIAVQPNNGAPIGSVGLVGPWRLLLRDLAHLLDTASVLVGWLWPLWDEQRRTFADMLARTQVRRVAPTRPPRNAAVRAAVVSLIAALLCIAGAVMSYLVVYQHGRTIDQTRAEIAARGPKIVEQMLTYNPKSLQDDFAHARSLVTDRYRERLEAEQQAVEKTKPVANEYWAVNSSVLSVAPRDATMLVFLQGERGDPGKERPISATVRVSFVKSATAQWLLDDLTVVTKPPPAEDGN